MGERQQDWSDLLVGDWFVRARWMGQHLVDGILQLGPEHVPVILGAHVSEATDSTAENVESC